MPGDRHPIESLMETAMQSIKEMVDVNTVVGEPVETPQGIIVIPISRVSCGFAAGGSEYAFDGEGKDNKDPKDQTSGKSGTMPFGGGSGAGVSVRPVGFLVVGSDYVRFLQVDANATHDRLIDMVPQVISQIQSFLGRKKQKEEEDLQGEGAGDYINPGC